ncbi:MAG: O-methyltransferase [Bacteroidales bacterium]|nr:O-methyltransferase [Bacteroidales bacterium]MCF8337044.1 O-methyltransferase [Bacteroidales bacterium]
MMIDKRLEEYIEQHTTKEDEVLYELNRQTHLKATKPRMLSGHIQGAYLKMVSHMIQPQKVLEIGTYTGYSAICLADGIRSGGKLITLEMERELEDFIKHYVKKAGLQSVIDLMIGDARDLTKNLDGPFDLVFIDAEKKDYLTYYEIVKPKLRVGGFILADNALWNGKVVDEAAADDPETAGIVAFNNHVHNDPEVENVLLPLRDGLMLLRKL